MSDGDDGGGASRSGPSNKKGAAAAKAAVVAAPAGSSSPPEQRRGQAPPPPPGAQGKGAEASPAAAAAAGGGAAAGDAGEAGDPPPSRPAAAAAATAASTTAATKSVRASPAGETPLAVDTTRAQAASPTPVVARPNGGGGGSRVDSDSVAEATLLRLTAGLSKHELRTVLDEADAVEELLLHEIRVLERALLRARQKEGGAGGGAKDDAGAASATRGAGERAEERKEGGKPGRTPAPAPAEAGADAAIEADPSELQAILDSCPFTPLDGYWTVSALLGRLRGPDMAIPASPMPHSSPPNPPGSAGHGGGAASATAASGRPSPSLSARNVARSSGGRDEARLLLDLENHPSYAAVHADPAALLALHKKLAAHRSSSVFRKPVKLEDAPGYDDRILFPVDLGLVRRQILARQVVTYRDLHERIGMIAHNCCKYNGRESDYGHVAREFEEAGDEMIRQAVLQLSPSSRRSTPVAGPSAFDGSPNASAALPHPERFESAPRPAAAPAAAAAGRSSRLPSPANPTLAAADAKDVDASAGNVEASK